jgi:hypothetical protein
VTTRSGCRSRRTSSRLRWLGRRLEGADFTAEDEGAIRELAAFAGATLDALGATHRSAGRANRLGRARQP